MSSWENHRPGFSLMEVLLSLGIMSIALVSLVAVLVTGLGAESQSTSRVNAQDFALQIMGRTLSEIEDLPLREAESFWSSDQSATPWQKGVETRNGTTFQYETHCHKLSVAGGRIELAGDRNQLKKVTIKVSWRDSTSKTKDSSLTIARILNREI